MDFLTSKIKQMYFKYLAAAFGSALISSVYGVVDMAMVGQYQGPEGMAVIFFDRELLLLFGAEETSLLLPLNIFSTYYFQALMRPKASFVVSVSRGAVISGALICILPAVAGANAIWLAMPVTELLVAIYVTIRMMQYTRAVSTKEKMC